MTKSTYYVSHNATRKQYIYQCGGKLNKNHNIGDTPNDTTGEGHIYKMKIAPSIHLLSTYHSLQPALWQRPRENIKSEDTIWYTSAPLGEK